MRTFVYIAQFILAMAACVYLLAQAMGHAIDGDNPAAAFYMVGVLASSLMALISMHLAKDQDRS